MTALITRQATSLLIVAAQTLYQVPAAIEALGAGSGVTFIEFFAATYIERMSKDGLLPTNMGEEV